MAMKTANEDVYSRIKSASSLIASGVRLGKPEMEAQGRQDFAAAHVENAILVHRGHLTDEARSFLSLLLHDQDTPAPSDADEPETDATDLEEFEEEEEEEFEEDE